MSRNRQTRLLAISQLFRRPKGHLRIILVIASTFFLFVSEQIFAQEARFTPGSMQDPSLNGRPNQGSGADLVKACFTDPNRDLACEKIIELNDFVRNFAEAAIRYSGLEKYQGIAGTLAAYAVNRKISWRFYSKEPDTVDLIYNNDTRILSISWTHRLK